MMWCCMKLVHIYEIQYYVHLGELSSEKQIAPSDCHEIGIRFFYIVCMYQSLHSSNVI